MSSTACIYCGANPVNNPNVIVHRTAPLGEAPAMWVCSLCLDKKAIWNEGSALLPPSPAEQHPSLFTSRGMRFANRRSRRPGLR